MRAAIAAGPKKAVAISEPELVWELLPLLDGRADSLHELQVLRDRLLQVGIVVDNALDLLRLRIVVADHHVSAGIQLQIDLLRSVDAVLGKGRAELFLNGGAGVFAEVCTLASQDDSSN